MGAPPPPPAKPPPPPKRPPPKPAVHPLAPAGEIVRARAATTPELALVPIAVRHCPVWSAAAVTTEDVVTLTVVGTSIVVTAPVVAVTVTEVPLTDLTWPRTAVNPAAAAGGEKLGRGLKVPPVPPPPNPPAGLAQEPLTGALRVTDAAVTIPPPPFVPAAVMQLPAVMSATVPVAVWVIVVVAA